MSPLLVEVEPGELPVEVPEGFGEEEKGTVVPVILNCWDWARMATPVGFCWTMLIWKPLPVGQPVEGPFTVVEPSEVETFCFKRTLILGYITVLDNMIEKLGGSVGTEVQATA